MDVSNSRTSLLVLLKISIETGVVFGVRIRVRFKISVSVSDVAVPNSSEVICLANCTGMWYG